MKILIIKTGAIGDVIRTTSILKGLKSKYKDSEIWWIVSKDSYEIIENIDLIDKKLMIENLKQENIKDIFDLIINLEDSREIAELVYKLDYKNIFGVFLDNGMITYSEDSNNWFDMSLISRFGKKKADELKKENKKSYQKIICEGLGIKLDKPIMVLEDEDIASGERFRESKGIKDNEIVIAINTGSGERWKNKSLPVEKTVELIKSIRNNFDAKLILLGGPNERKRNKEIIKKIEEKDKDIVDSGCENSLREFAAIINICDILICSDSLAMNIGIALDKKVIAFFGPTPAAEIELYGKGIKITPDMDCLVCYKNDCDKKIKCNERLKIYDFIEGIRKLI